MPLRVLAITLCLSLLVPTCRPDDKASRSAQVAENQEMRTATETAVGSAGNNPGRSAEASEPREKEAATQTAAAAAPGSPQPLSQEEELSLSARAEEPGPEVSGGALSNLHLTYAVIALGAILLVLLVK